MKRTHLSLAIGLVVGLSCLVTAYADDAPQSSTTSASTAKPSEAKQLEGIKVTARKREETLQDVPIAVSAFTAQSLFNQNVQNLADLQGKVPSLQIYAARGSNTTLTAYIRGVGQADPTWGFDPAVGIYLRRRLYGAPPGHSARRIRHQPHRSAARPAGQPVRQKHHWRRHQIRV
nr:TonB-dependent receptor plug domain-containing protein [Dyella terrae]